MVELGEHRLTLGAIDSVVFGGEPVELSSAARARVKAAAEFVEQLAQKEEPIYGVTTGFGANRDQFVEPALARQLQERLLLSHACGLGDPLPEEVVRAMMLLRINALAQGNSGLRLETLELLAAMLNARLHPIVPELGSVGSSGDLCPLAHMALPMIGAGEAIVEGQRMPGAAAMAAVGLVPVGLTYKEGIALLNGTQAMTALGVVVAREFGRLLDCADAVGTMSLEACGARAEAFDARLHRARGHRGQQQVAQNVRALTAGSELFGVEPGQLEGKVDYVQDAYSLRCMPQVHGACRDVWAHVVEVLEREANAVTDNPLVFLGPEGGAILSGGNFHGEPVGMALDYLKIAIAELGSIAERRCAKLVDRHHNEGLPAFLTPRPGLNSGMMIPQYVAAALVTQNKVQAFPATVDSIPTSANMEDHNSMGQHAGLGALRMLINTQRIVGIEYLLSAQALDLREERWSLGEGSRRARALLREHVPGLQEDRWLQPDIEHAVELVCEGSLWEQIEGLLEPAQMG